MENILYLDIEASKSGEIYEYGLVYNDKYLKTSSLESVKKFINQNDVKYIAGHNFISFDKTLLEQTSFKNELNDYILIDTLPVSLLLFNEKTFHALPKKYKNEDNFYNDPIEDSLLTRQLFIKIIKKFKNIPKKQQLIFYSLLSKENYFKGFFHYIDMEFSLEILVPEILEKTIAKLYEEVIINKLMIKETMFQNRVELAYILALLTPVTEIKAHPPKILFDYPKISKIQEKLCFDFKQSCNNLSAFAEDTFGFGSFRDFKRLEEGSLFENSVLSQREIIEAALKNDSFIAVLPTGGGKTFTFWLPALIKAKAYKSLTVVISPLQALIKDHIDSFQKQVANFNAVAISGFLSALERSDAIDKVINGDADILYIAPESLRSNSIFSMLKNRVIERFVIDEAHCISTWGNDFRHDYFYIGAFIQDLLKEKNYQEHIPISCFTATAKPNVISDISHYIDETLSIKLNRYLALPQRKNLEYEALHVKDKRDKYRKLLTLLQDRQGATLIYIPSSTKMCDDIAMQLSIDTDRSVKAFHSKLENEEKMKILDDYINNRLEVVVATTAFGMGVDKPNILNVIHYEASESLENYSQEAGRGARDQNLTAQCPLLFDESDLDKHFNTLNRSKTSLQEINAIFRVIKSSVQNPLLITTLELAKAAHWDVEDSSNSYEVKVKTALLELERDGYLERKRNKVRYFGDSVVKHAMEKLQFSIKKNLYDEELSQRLILVLQTLLGRGKPQAVQIDEMALLLGYKKQSIAESMLILKELDIISQSKDMTLRISRDSIEHYKKILEIERKLFNYFKENKKTTVGIRELNEILITKKVIDISDNRSVQIKEILKYWREKEIFTFTRIQRSKDIWSVIVNDIGLLQENNRLKHEFSKKIVDFFTRELDKKTTVKKFEIEFSIQELKQEIVFDKSVKKLERILIYLHEMKLLELMNGRFIYYAPMSLHKTDKVKQKLRYTKDEYKNRMAKHYQQKIESIHIMGKYADKLLKNRSEALSFMKDYFILSYEKFKSIYKLNKKISRPLTQKKYEQIYKQLSNEQQLIMQDSTTQGMMILAGPGSGKTKVLVHKIAALILSEDVKPEQFLMLTFSRTAMMEFKSRLYGLIGSLVAEVDIATFHGYALQLTARHIDETNTKELLQNTIQQAVRQIKDGIVEIPFKTVLVIDEYQDINEASFEFVKAIYESLSKDLRIIAVGDDDQCIMERTNGADITYIDKFKSLFDEDKCKIYELLNNFRSDKAIIDYTQSYIKLLTKRYKQNSLKVNTKNDGLVCFYHTSAKYLLEPILKLCQKEIFNGSSIILAHTNDEVLDIYSILKAYDFDVTYLLDNVNFKVRLITEIYYFDKELSLEENIDEDILYAVKEKIKARFRYSKNLYMIDRLVELFAKSSDIYSRSIWNSFLDELDITMFEIGAKFHVSTIHKSKGKEFDNVVMTIPDAKEDDYFRRLYYVGMTRAKHELHIFSNSSQFNLSDNISMDTFSDNNSYENRKQITLLMGLKDINLGFSGSHEINNFDLISGSELKCYLFLVNKPRVLMQDGESIAQFSRVFDEKIAKYELAGYIIDTVKIESVIHWQDSEKNIQRIHPLCQIILKKHNLSNSSI